MSKRLSIVVSTCVLALACVLVASLMVTTPAWADENKQTISVSGTDHYGVVDAEGRIDVLLATAPSDTKVYVTVKYGKQAVLKDFEQSVASTEPELIMLSAKAVDLKHLNKYTITVKDARGDAGAVLYEGKLQGVYGTMHNTAQNTNKKVLIGVRTLAVNGTEDGRTFQAPSTFYYDDSNYQLSQDKPNKDGVYQYEQYDAANTVTGKITYVDQDGTIIREPPSKVLIRKALKPLLFLP